MFRIPYSCKVVVAVYAKIALVLDHDAVGPVQVLVHLDFTIFAVLAAVATHELSQGHAPVGVKLFEKPAVQREIQNPTQNAVAVVGLGHAVAMPKINAFALNFKDYVFVDLHPEGFREKIAIRKIVVALEDMHLCTGLDQSGQGGKKGEMVTRHIIIVLVPKFKKITHDNHMACIAAPRHQQLDQLLFAVGNGLWRVYAQMGVAKEVGRHIHGHNVIKKRASAAFYYLSGMRKFAHMLFICSMALLAGCSINLTQGDLEGIPQTSEKYSFFGNIPFVYGGDTLELDQNLLKAYTAAASAEAFPRESCRGSATVQASVVNNSKGSAWALGATIIPFWPVQPVDESWTYKLDARIFCNGTLVKHVEFSEEGAIKASLYGKLRSDLVNQMSGELHRKIVQRLSFELSDNRPADMNIMSDF